MLSLRVKIIRGFRAKHLVLKCVNSAVKKLESFDKLRMTRQNLMREYYVYIMSSESGVLYTGVIDNLPRRVLQHKKKVNKGFYFEI